MHHFNTHLQNIVDYCFRGRARERASRLKNIFIYKDILQPT